MTRTASSRALYEPEHHQLAESFAAFLRAHVAPHYEAWEEAGVTPRDLFSRAGADGFLAFEVPEAYGGAEVVDFRFNAAIIETLAESSYGALSAGLSMHNDI